MNVAVHFRAPQASLIGQKKSARWISPRISQRALSFWATWLRPCPIDFPPEIKIGSFGPAFGGWSFEEADLAQNDFKLPENQEMERIS